jgi:hypothetical protein
MVFETTTFAPYFFCTVYFILMYLQKSKSKLQPSKTHAKKNKIHLIYAEKVFLFQKNFFCLFYLLNYKKIEFDWLPPYDMLAKDRELQRNKTKNSARAEFKKNETSRWVELIMKARIFFE